MTFSAAHVIIGHERCGTLHGHDYAISVRLEGEPADNGMIMDFGTLKDIVREIVKGLDHKFLVAKNHKNVSIKGDIVLIKSGCSEYQIPLCDCAVLDINQTSAEELAMCVGGQLKEKLVGRDNLKVMQIKVEESMGQSIWHSVEL